MSLAAPLDEAICFYRAQSYDPANTIIPDEGSSGVAMQLGPTLGTDAEDPAYVSDAAGKYLNYSANGKKYGYSAIPAASLNGDFSIVLRFQPLTSWQQRCLVAVRDIVSGTPIKHILVTIDASNRVLLRVFESDPNHSQVDCQCMTTVLPNNWYNLVCTWDSNTLQLSVYINGALKAMVVANHSRDASSGGGIYWGTPFVIGQQNLLSDTRRAKQGFVGRCYSATEVAGLETNLDLIG